MNNKMIGECENCEQLYCMECSEHKHRKDFCTDDCYDEWRKENSLKKVKNEK